MNTTPYTPPVDKLLTLGEPEPFAPDRWLNYLELGLGPEYIPNLIRMATDQELSAASRPGCYHTTGHVSDPAFRSENCTQANKIFREEDHEEEKEKEVGLS